MRRARNTNQILRRSRRKETITRNWVNLPIDKVKEEFVKSYENNDITIINTPTGSGKTMRVPFWAYNQSNKQSYCLVPRRKMAQSAVKGAYCTTWVNSPMGKEGDLDWAVGQDGKRKEDLVDKKVVYCTEGSFLSREMQNYTEGSTIIIDEVHEQNVDTEILLLSSTAWAKQGHKIVLMSATMDIDKYKVYFEQKGLSVGYVKLENDGSNRPYNVDLLISSNPLKELAEEVLGGKRALVGVAGGKEHSQIANELNMYFIQKGQRIPVYFFHSRMEEEEWMEAMNYEGPCVYIATNVLQSGHTVNNINVGYFTGNGRRMVNKDGTDMLETYTLSRSELLQWHGRLGRTCPGTIYWSEGQKNVFEKQSFLPTPKIELQSLEDTFAHFLVKGFSLLNKENKLLNHPSSSRLMQAVETLEKLNVYDNKKLLKEIMKKGQGVRNGLLLLYADLKNVDLSVTMRMLLEIQSADPFGFCKSDALKELSGIYQNKEKSELMNRLKHIKAIMTDLGAYNPRIDKFLPLGNLSKEEKAILKEKKVFIKGLYQLNAKFRKIQKEHKESNDKDRENKNMIDKEEAVIKGFKAAWADRVYKKVGNRWYHEKDEAKDDPKTVDNNCVISSVDFSTVVAIPYNIDLGHKVIKVIKTPFFY